MMTKVGLIGLGAMGSNHARIINESPRATLHRVFDANKAVCERVAGSLNTIAAGSLEELEDCDAVVIATSTASHVSIADHFLERRIAMLIEKPLCGTLAETRGIIQRSETRGNVLMCGFVERFNPAVTTAIKLIDGPVRHLSSYRHSPYNPRASSGVVTDLLIHDLDLTTRLAPSGSLPKVGASTWKPSEHSFTEIADCTLQYGDEMTALQSASRWGQRKIREIRISTDGLLLEVDLLRVTVTAYRHRSQGGTPEEPMTYRSETMIEVPFVRHAGEPLGLQFDHFLDLVDGVTDPKAELATLEAPHVLADMVDHVGSLRD
jgi:predicted dehydrogenase